MMKRTLSTALLTDGRSAKSLSNVTDLEFDPVVVPVTYDNTFEEMFPAICLKFGCPNPIVVRKQYRHDTYFKQLKHSDRSLFKKNKIKMPMIERSSARQAKTQAALYSKLTDLDSPSSYIIVTSIYDSLNRLSTLAVSKAPKVPRVLIRSIGLLAPVFDTLNNLTITRCGIDGQIVYDLFKILPKTNITEICLDQSRAKEGNYALLLEMPSKLRNLSLCRCCINDVVVQQIAERLHYPHGSQALQLLNLASNDISDEGARHLANALRSNRHLRYLNLSDNHITDNGASYLLNTLQEFPLSVDDLKKKRERYQAYMKTREELYRKLLRDFGVKQFEEIGRNSSKSSQKTLRKKSWTSLKQSKGKTSRQKSADRELPMTSVQFLKNRADALADKMLGPFVDPYSKSHLTVTNGWFHCHGNFTLSYLNLAYNNLSLMMIKNLFIVVSYQIGKLDLHESGLLKIVIDGNNLAEKCEEMEKITQLMQKNMTRYMGTVKPPTNLPLADHKKNRAHIQGVLSASDIKDASHAPQPT